MQTGCALGYVPPAAVEHGAYRFLLNALDIVLQGLARLKVCATPVHGLAGRGQVQELCCKAAVPIHHEHGLDQDVLQFPDVSRVVVFHELAQHTALQQSSWTCPRRMVLFNQRLGQIGDIAPAFPQGRNIQGDHAEAVV